MVPAGQPEPHAAEFLAELRATRAAILAREPAARLFVFWDFDGTLLHGDCSEGLYEQGQMIYPGLVQCAIEAGYSEDYVEAVGFPVCWGDYRLLGDRFGDWLAFPFLAQIFAGAAESALRELAERHFGTSLAPYYYAASRLILDGLAADGIEQHVLSASPDFFVGGAARGLGLPPDRLHGIRLRTVQGRLTRDVLFPATYAGGKVARLQEILAAAAQATPDRPAYVLGAFGNSYATDGAFVTHVAGRELPAGRPLAVMVNAGHPPPGVARSVRAVRQTACCGRAAC